MKRDIGGGDGDEGPLPSRPSDSSFGQGWIFWLPLYYKWYENWMSSLSFIGMSCCFQSFALPWEWIYLTIALTVMKQKGILKIHFYDLASSLFFVPLDVVHGEGMGESLDIKYSFCGSILNSRFQQGVGWRAAWTVRARMSNGMKVSSRESSKNEIWVCRPLSSSLVLGLQKPCWADLSVKSSVSVSMGAPKKQKGVLMMGRGRVNKRENSTYNNVEEKGVSRVSPFLMTFFWEVPSKGTNREFSNFRMCIPSEVVKMRVPRLYPFVFNPAGQWRLRIWIF